LHRVPEEMQRFADGSSAAKRLKNTAVAHVLPHATHVAVAL